jgi:hypothetical protein
VHKPGGGGNIMNIVVGSEELSYTPTIVAAWMTKETWLKGCARYPKGYLKGTRGFPRLASHFPKVRHSRDSGEARHATKANANLPPQSTHQ